MLNLVEGLGIVAQRRQDFDEAVFSGLDDLGIAAGKRLDEMPDEARIALGRSGQEGGLRSRGHPRGQPKQAEHRCERNHKIREGVLARCHHVAENGGLHADQGRQNPVEDSRALAAQLPLSLQDFQNVIELHNQDYADRDALVSTSMC